MDRRRHIGGETIPTDKQIIDRCYADKFTYTRTSCCGTERQPSNAMALAAARCRPAIYTAGKHEALSGSLSASDFY